MKGSFKQLHQGIYKTAGFVFIILLFLSCQQKKKNAAANDHPFLQQECVHRLTAVIVYDIFTPPVASRIYAYSNLAWYEALRRKDPAAISITSRLHGFDPMPVPQKDKVYNYTVAAVHSFFTVAKSLTFSKDSLAQTETQLLSALKAEEEAEVYQRSVQFGESVANTILKRAGTDQYKITRGMPRYSVFKEPGRWIQTPPDYADAVEPNWRLIRPMLLDSAAQFKPVPPTPYSTDKNSPYYKEMMEVYTTHKNLTPEQDSIARYWDDNPFVTTHEGHLTYATKKTTPGGHWMGIINILCRQTKKNDVNTGYVYALSSCALFDGFISCWDEKYRSRTVRPVTVIRELLDPEWTPLLQTPPFPEYTSGHSVITASVSTVLTSLMGDPVVFTDTTELEYLGMKRSFISINQAADEAGMSRLYGGIHYRPAIEEGKKQGQAIGRLYISRFSK